MAPGCGARTDLAVEDDSAPGAPGCPRSFADCDGRAENGCETDLHSSQQSCGECNHGCEAGLFCGAGHCRAGDDIVQIAARAFHTCALRASGDLACWGDNDHGELGDGTTVAAAVPVPVVGLSDVAQVSCGSSRTCARTRNGQLWCWGWNDAGQVGDGTTSDRWRPVLALNVGDVAHVDAGGSAACALHTTGQVSCWGDGQYGGLGGGDFTSSFEPVRVVALPAAEQLAIGSASCVTAAGEVYCWGEALQHGAWGDGNPGDDADRAAPALIPIDQVLEVKPAFGTCALRAPGELWCWGYGAGGLRPSLAPGLSDGVTLAHGTVTNHKCVSRRTGTVVCWGEARLTGTAHGTGYGPFVVEGLDEVVDLVAGSWHTCALRADSSVWCWGENELGQLGDGTNSLRRTPVRVFGLP